MRRRAIFTIAACAIAGGVTGALLLRRSGPGGLLIGAVAGGACGALAYRSIMPWPIPRRARYYSETSALYYRKGPCDAP